MPAATSDVAFSNVLYVRTSSFAINGSVPVRSASSRASSSAVFFFATTRPTVLLKWPLNAPLLLLLLRSKYIL